MCPGHLTPNERNPGTQWLVGFMGPTACQDSVRKQEYKLLLQSPYTEKIILTYLKNIKYS